jgi:5-(carboxyamino)imidazole ribonucleotide synthase
MPISPPEFTLGVVGGGQLGRMLGEAAAPLGVDVVVTDPTPAPPAAPTTREAITGAFDDPETLRVLADRADALTFEIELADPELLETVSEEYGVPVHPHPETLGLIEDKLHQKRQLRDAGVSAPEFRAVDTAEELAAACEDLGYPAMLKARRGGYDGRGNVLVSGPDEVEDAMAVVGGPAMVEAFVDYERELAIMAAQGDGERALFPVTETVHEAEILRETVSPARTTEAVRERAREVAHDVLDVMSGRGVYGIELFETSDGAVLLNEIAPRPHNSGHWTIEGAHTSQFEQHVRAVTGRPLGDVDRRAPTASVNVLGDVDERQHATLSGERAVFETPRANLHWYGKREVYRLRKMGHVTLIGEPDEDPESVLEDARVLKQDLTFRE